MGGSGKDELIFSGSLSSDPTLSGLRFPALESIRLEFDVTHGDTDTFLADLEPAIAFFTNAHMQRATYPALHMIELSIRYKCSSALHENSPWPSAADCERLAANTLVPLLLQAAHSVRLKRMTLNCVCWESGLKTLRFTSRQEASPSELHRNARRAVQAFAALLEENKLLE